MKQATSNLLFTYTRSPTPNKTRMAVGRATADLNVRVWVGKNHPTVSFSPLKKYDVIDISDSILAKDGVAWYYVRKDGKYGFACSRYIEIIPNKAWEFIRYLKDIDLIVKKHPKQFKYQYDPTLKSIPQLIERVNSGKIVSLTCLVPEKLAFQRMGFKRSDGKTYLMCTDGKFGSTYSGDFEKYMTHITKGEAIGLTCEQAEDKGLLRTGDVIGFKGYTHTFVYSGKECLMFDGGHKAIKNGVYTGIEPSYEKEKRKISEIIRWKL